MLTTYHHPVPLSRNLGTLTSWNPLGHSRPVTGLLYLYLYQPQVRREEYSGDIICTAVGVISTKESEWLIFYVSS